MMAGYADQKSQNEQEEEESDVSDKIPNETEMFSKTSAEEIESPESMLKFIEESKGQEFTLMNSGVEGNRFVTMSNSPARSIACPGEWVRRLGYMETFMALGGDHGTLNTIQGLWVSSTRPILPEDVRQALTIVAQQTDVMQLCVQWWGLWPWFRRIKGLLIPFKVEHDDVMSVYYKILRRPYEMSRGPLWRARLVPLPSRSPGRYEAVLMIAAHHCITDGLTNMVLCRETLEVLNAIMSGRQHTVSSGMLMPNIAEEHVTMRDWLFALKMFCSKLYGITNYSTKLYFDGALQQPATSLPITKVLHKEYTVETSQQLRQRCETANVTVYSCTLAAAYLAMLSVVQKDSKKLQSEALINGVNCFNMRPYYSQEYEQSPGCHISLEEHEFLVRSCDAQSKANFWCLAICLNSRLKRNFILDKTPITNSPLFSTLMLHINLLLTSLGCKHCTDSHFATTNMGDLRDLLPGKYDGPVEITNLLRSVSSEIMGHPFNLSFHTFLERFMISLDYCTTNVTDEMAELFFSTLTNYITNIAHHGTVLVNPEA
ncbi:uncharacterized protein [Procambarus clarkii]|uniref:uncharacterized protein n=1 Tax=Procambarus clarkii TaxID=6728 RepID=UPI003744ADCB